METIETTTPQLRGHHLVCLQFYHGEGYSPDFVVNLMRIIKSSDSNGVRVVAGNDDVCTACPRLSGSTTCMLSHDGEKGVRELDALALELLDVEPGDHVDMDELRSRVLASLDEWQAQACSQCGWEQVCKPVMELMAL